MVKTGMLEELEDFLKDIPPFNLLPGKALEEIVPTLTVQKFSTEDLILSPDGPPTRFLYLIRSGAVKFTIPGKGDNDTEQIVDMRHEREFFGVFSLWSNRPSPFTIIAKKKTVCYLLKKEVFTRLLDDYANFLLYFTMGPSKGFRSTGPHGGLEKGSDFSGLETDSLLFLVRVRDIMKSQVITCPQGQTVVDAARLMTLRRVGSLIVLDEKDQPLGIITDGDMRQKVIASGLPPQIPVAQIMSSPLLSVPSEAFYFEALIAMIRHRVKYLPIIDGGKLAGILSERDLVVSQGNNPAAVIRRIYQAPDVDVLVQIRKNINQTLKVLMNRGWQAKETFELITQLNDHLTVRLIQLAEESMEIRGFGKPPLPYVWMALGSEGRQEQTLCTDQDNALIFADTDISKEPEIQAYFLSLAQQVVSGLERCGFPLCSGGMMASNPQWCKPLRVWKSYFRKWILDRELSTQDIMISSLFFDFRAIHGAGEFISELRNALDAYISESKVFLSHLALRSLELQTPLSFFNRLVVQKSGTYKNKFNIKLNGLMPLVDAIRVLSLEQKLFKSNTLERIDALLEKGVFTAAESNDLREAFNLMMLLRLQNHLGQMNQGKELDNYINPDELSLIQRSVLKTAFKSIAQLQSRIETRFGLSALRAR
jgi:CBS domain-containing protein